jgi:hypothetical protein
LRPFRIGRQATRVRDFEVVAGVPLANLVRLSGLVEALERVLADRVEHAEPIGFPATKEALVEERLEPVQVGATDLLGSVQVE